MILPRLVLFGDSIAGSMRGTRASRSIQAYAQRRLPGHHIIEVTRSGWALAGTGLWRAEPQSIPALNPAVVVCWIGVNDFAIGVELETFGNALTTLLAIIHSRGSTPRVIFMLPGWTAVEEIPNAIGHTLDQYREAIMGFAVPGGYTILDPRMAVKPREYRSFSEDPSNAVHYNDRGNRKVGLWLGNTLRSLLA